MAASKKTWQKVVVSILLAEMAAHTTPTGSVCTTWLLGQGEPNP